MRVEGDPTRLAQVVSNLLNNAAKYTEEGGRIELTVEAKRRPGGPAGAGHGRRHRGGHAAAHLRDVHPGARLREHRSEGGLGIGLTLVRSLVEMHGGSVQATSEGLGHGSEFVVRLPLFAESTSAGSRGGNEPERTRKGPPGASWSSMTTRTPPRAGPAAPPQRPRGAHGLRRPGRPGPGPGAAARRGAVRHRHAGHGWPGSGPPPAPGPRPEATRCWWP